MQTDVDLLAERQRMMDEWKAWVASKEEWVEQNNEGVAAILGDALKVPPPPPSLPRLPMRSSSFILIRSPCALHAGCMCAKTMPFRGRFQLRAV